MLYIVFRLILKGFRHKLKITKLPLLPKSDIHALTDSMFLETDEPCVEKNREFSKHLYSLTLLDMLWSAFYMLIAIPILFVNPVLLK